MKTIIRLIVVAGVLIALTNCGGGGGGGSTPDTTPPSIISLIPNQGLSTASTPSVNIQGTNFNASTAIYIGSTAVPGGNCTLNSSSSITCTIPGSGNGSAFGLRDVTANNGSGLTGTFANGWKYIGVLNETNVALEADYCNIQLPTSLSVTTGVSTDLIYGQIYEAGTTDLAGASANVSAQVGYGPSGTDPTTQPTDWTYVNASFNAQVGNNDEYQASFVAPASGSYLYTYRFSLDGGASYTYCDLDGAGSSNGFDYSSTQLGAMTVNP
jgi:IPT/TIG domain